MIEQTAKDYVKQAYRDGKKPSFCAAEKALKRGMIWQAWKSTDTIRAMWRRRWALIARLCALGLVRFLQTTKWQAWGLSNETN